MSEKTGIQWTDHTFNIAWGCTKVSAGCANCYADTQSHRYGFDVWGPGKERRVFGEKHWNEPRKWNRDAEKEGRRHRVFCSSMCDVFEAHPTIDAEREKKLWILVEQTPWLDWQILTKRAERLPRLVKWSMPNVWLGVSVEDQKTADERIPLLLQTPAAVRFVSYEPALDRVDFRQWLEPTCAACEVNAASPGHRDDHDHAALDWIIAGGESGPKARPFDVAWARKTVEDCKAAGVACFVKQLGSRPTGRHCECGDSGCDYLHNGDQLAVKHRKGGDMAEWPADLRVREFPRTAAEAAKEGV